MAQRGKASGDLPFPATGDEGEGAGGGGQHGGEGREPGAGVHISGTEALGGKLFLQIVLLVSGDVGKSPGVGIAMIGGDDEAAALGEFGEELPKSIAAEGVERFSLKFVQATVRAPEGVQPVIWPMMPAEQARGRGHGGSGVLPRKIVRGGNGSGKVERSCTIVVQ